jgi:hypothetical protein
VKRRALRQPPEIGFIPSGGHALRPCVEMERSDEGARGDQAIRRTLDAGAAQARQIEQRPWVDSDPSRAVELRAN